MDSFDTKCGHESTDSHHNFPCNPPSEVVQHIFRFLRPESLAQVRLVNQFFKANANALMSVSSYWVAQMSLLEAEASVSLLKRMFKAAAGSSSLGMKNALVLSRGQWCLFDRQVLMRVWLRATSFRSLSERILIGVYCYQSRTLSDLTSSQIFADFWGQVVMDMDNAIFDGNKLSAPDEQRCDYMDFFRHFKKLQSRRVICEKYQLPLDFFDRKQLVLALVAMQGRALKYASMVLQSDFAVVTAAVRQDGNALKYASQDLRSHPDIVRLAVSHSANGRALKYAGEMLKQDDAIVLAAVRHNGHAYVHIDNALKNRVDIMAAAVSSKGYALEYASNALKNSVEIVTAAVLQNGFSLQFASKELQDNATIVLAAVQQDGFSLKFASKALRNNHDIVMAAVKKDAGALRYASVAMRNTITIVLAAVEQCGVALKFVSKSLQHNEEVVLAAVRQNGAMLEYAAAPLKNHPAIVLAAVEQSGGALQYANEDLIRDADFLSEVESINPDALRYLNGARPVDGDTYSDYSDYGYCS